METSWAITSTVLLVFCLWLVYVVGIRRGYKAGYKKGAERILNEWKQSLYEESGE